MPSTKQVLSAASTRSSAKQDTRQTVRGGMSRSKPSNNPDAKGECSMHALKHRSKIKK